MNGLVGRRDVSRIRPNACIRRDHDVVCAREPSASQMDPTRDMRMTRIVPAIFLGAALLVAASVANVANAFTTARDGEYGRHHRRHRPINWPWTSPPPRSSVLYFPTDRAVGSQPERRGTALQWGLTASAVSVSSSFPPDSASKTKSQLARKSPRRRVYASTVTAPLSFASLVVPSRFVGFSGVARCSTLGDDNADDDDEGYFDDDEEEEELEEETTFEEEEIGSVDNEDEEDEMEYEFDDELEDEDEVEETMGRPAYIEGEEDMPPVEMEKIEPYEEDETVEIEDDPDESDYQTQKDFVETTVKIRNKIAEDADFDPVNYMLNEMTDEEMEELDADPINEEVEKEAAKLKMLTEEDIKNLTDQDHENAGTFDDDEGPEAFPDDGEEGDLVYPDGIRNADLVELDRALKEYKVANEMLENKTYFGEGNVMAYMGDVEELWDRLDESTQDEIHSVIFNSSIASPDPYKWLIYDLDFNVTNLILAAFQHNPNAPLIFNQWFPQLEHYARYENERMREFHFDWDDVAAADITELERYYRGIGHDEIPKKNPGDTGIITLDTGMDEEDREMAALENWYDEVFDEESENLMFDDDNFEPRDNVFDHDYGMQDDPMDDKILNEYEKFQKKYSDHSQEWRNQFATLDWFKENVDEDGAAAFRGHLVVACTPSDEDMDMAEKITLRMEKEFGKEVFVETRVLGHAHKEDNVFEIWLESYEIDLLHSKRQSVYNAKRWDGPGEIDDDHLEYLVGRVKYLISDEQRYSYRLDDFVGQV